MDFRVYLDGIQRIVSGVTLETTCKDIVLCLAQATQQFGKFILVERWRNNERLLNPNDYPIKLLSQWGEYASDVMFIMKRCDQPLADSSAKLQSSANHNLQLQHQLRQQQPRQYQPNDPNLLASKVNQSQSGNRVESNHLKPTNLISENQDHYGSCIPRKHVYYQEEKLINMPSKSSSQSTPLNQSGISQESPIDIESDYGTNQALMKRPKHPPPYYEAITKSSLLRSSPSDPVEASPEASGMHWLQGEAGNSSICSKGINRSNCEDQEENQNMVKISRNSEEVKNKQPYRHDEIKLSSLQKDTLNANNRQILEINSSINYWDSKFRSLNAQQRQDVLNDSRRLDRLSEIQRESMINVESDELNDNNELTRFDMEPKAIEVDKNKLRTQLSEIENQIADCRHSIEQLMDQINQLNLQKEEDELLKRREETKMKTQLIEMTKEKSIEFERQSEQLRMVDEELKESDEMLKERIKKIEKILQDLKEANLQGLSLLPRDELFSKTPSQMKTSQSHVIINPDARNSFQTKQQRPGSTRKMFVPPRELKNAVATSKNPHGVWV